MPRAPVTGAPAYVVSAGPGFTLGGATPVGECAGRGGIVYARQKQAIDRPKSRGIVSVFETLPDLSAILSFLHQIWGRVIAEPVVAGLIRQSEALIAQYGTDGLKVLIGAVIGAGALVLLRVWRDHRAYRVGRTGNDPVVTLTTLTDGVLQIFTLATIPFDRLFPNPGLRRTVAAAIAATTESDPILRFRRDVDRQLAYTEAVNQVSALFREGLIAQSLCRWSESIPCVVVLTWERAGPAASQRLRVVVVSRDVMLAWPKEAPKVQKAVHATRHKTLLAIRKRFLEMPKTFETIVAAVPRFGGRDLPKTPVDAAVELDLEAEPEGAVVPEPTSA